jgi:hypothetical protein
MTELKTYIARESTIGSIINLAIGSVFYLVVFRGQSDPAIWGGQGLIVDCLPQGFMVGLMSIIPAMLITRKRVNAGLDIPTDMPGGWLPKNVFARGVVVALASMIGLVAIAAGFAAATGVQSMPFWTGFVLKALPGLIVPWIVIPPAIRVVLAQGPASSSART